VLLSFASDRLPTSQRITANVASFTTLAEDDADRSFAVALDGELESPTGELADMLATLQRLDDDAVLRAMFNGLSPGAYGTFSTTALDSATQVVATTQQWIAGLRADAGRYGDGFLGGHLTNAFASAPAGGGRMWGINFNGADAVAPLNDSSLTFDHGLRGFAYGVDLRSGPRGTLGFSVASTAARQGAADAAQSGMLRSQQFSLYGTRLLGQRGYVDAVLSYGDTRHDTARLLTTRSGGREALARYDGSVRSFLTEAGYRLGVAGRSELYGSLHYAAERIDAVSEAGAGGLGLVFADRDHVRLDSELGILWGTELTTRWGVMEPRASIGWIHREQLGRRTYRARFAGAGHWFRLHDGHTDDHGMRLAGSLQLGRRYGMSLSARLAAELWRNDATGLLELRATFR
jgi:uncharacterized protein with beta-barrel porin domain